MNDDELLDLVWRSAPVVALQADIRAAAAAASAPPTPPPPPTAEETATAAAAHAVFRDVALRARALDPDLAADCMSRSTVTPTDPTADAPSPADRLRDVQRRLPSLFAAGKPNGRAKPSWDPSS